MASGDGRNTMQYLFASPLKQHTVSISVDEDVTRNDFPDEVRKETAASFIKVQKKGTVEMVTLAISEVQTWDNFHKALQKHFPSSSAEPQITSFDGCLITSPEEYKKNLKPGLHLIVYFPPTVDELSQSLSSLFFENISSTTSSFKLSSNPYFVPPASIPDSSELADYLNPPSSAPKTSSRPTRYHLQPPNIYFTVSSPTSISITLSNPPFQNIAYHPGENIRQMGGPPVTNYIITGYQNPPATPSPGGSNHGIAWQFERPSTDYTLMKQSSGFPTKPSGSIQFPPWNPYPIYDRVNQGEGVKEGEIKSSPYRIVAGGIFPMTSFDLFAQSQRKRVMCSIGWDVLACPMEGLKDIVSEEPISNISWAVLDGGKDRPGSSEKRIYANYEGPIDPDDDNSDGQSVGWWMVGPRKLPTRFSGEAGEHTFLLNSMAEVAAHLRVFMTRCGIEDDVIEGFINYWTQALELPEPATQVGLRDSLANPFIDYRRTNTSTPKLILLKFLHPRDLRNLLPLSLTPEPHRVVRIFAVFRVVEQRELDAEGIYPCGDLEMEVDRVLGGIGSCGGGWDCGHRGFKVAEVGGVRVFSSDDEDRRDDRVGEMLAYEFGGGIRNILW